VHIKDFGNWPYYLFELELIYWLFVRHNEPTSKSNKVTLN